MQQGHPYLNYPYPYMYYMPHQMTPFSQQMGPKPNAGGFPGATANSYPPSSSTFSAYEEMGMDAVYHRPFGTASQGKAGVTGGGESAFKQVSICCWLCASHMTNTPSHMANAPSHMINTPSRMTNTPSHMTNTPSHMTNAPGHMTNAPGHMTNAPSHMTNAPGHMINTPSHMTNTSSHMTSM